MMIGGLTELKLIINITQFFHQVNDFIAQTIVGA
jgi:hypothetical protein